MCGEKTVRLYYTAGLDGNSDLVCERPLFGADSRPCWADTIDRKTRQKFKTAINSSKSENGLILVEM